MRFCPNRWYSDIGFFAGKLNDHRLHAGGLKFGWLSRRLKAKASERRWF
jgi:hypothetical protein